MNGRGIFIATLGFLLAARCVVAQTCTLPVSIVPRKAALAAAPDVSMLVIAQPAGVRAVRVAPAPPARVLLLIDGSAGMGQGKRWQAAQAETDALLQAAPPGVGVAVAAFEDKTTWAADFTAPAAGLMPAIENGFAKHKPAGGAALYDAIASGLDRPNGLHPGDAIVALSDGDDYRSRDAIVEIVGSLQHSGVRLFLLGNPNAEGVKAAAQLLAGQTGGAVRKTSNRPNAKEAAEDAQWFWDLLAHQYMLTIGYNGAVSATLKLQPAPGVGVRVIYPQTLAICAAPPG